MCFIELHHFLLGEFEECKLHHTAVGHNDFTNSWSDICFHHSYGDSGAMPTDLANG